MNSFTVCYDKFCMGRYALSFDEAGDVVSFEGLGAFEMYLLSMWGDGMVVTMKGYNEVKEEVVFVLLLPDGSEQVMRGTDGGRFVMEAYKNAGEGRFAYMVEFLGGLECQGFRGYEEYDEEEGMIIGTVVVGEETLVYGGRCMREVKEEFKRLIYQYIKMPIY